MNRTGFHYRVEAVVEFTGRDLAVLDFLSQQHYDGRCKSTFRVGGFGYGWLMTFLHDTGDESLSLLDLDIEKLAPELAARKLEVVVTGSQVDHLRKVIEAAEFTPRSMLSQENLIVASKLMMDLGMVFREMNDESRRLHGRGEEKT